MHEALSIKHLIVGVAMFAALGATAVLQPQKTAAGTAKFALNEIVPEAFDRWRVDQAARAVVASPDVQKTLSEVYSDILSRTYINDRGERVMLSIAYSGDIVRQMDVHRPEVCYPAQGFIVVQEPSKALLPGVGAGLGVTRLVAKQGPRVEPITYWITAGDNAGVSAWERKLVRLRYGLTGQLPDGMLVRVSTIGQDTLKGFRIQEEFVQTMVAALAEKDRRRFLGTAL